jgi:hypothetical protein
VSILLSEDFSTTFAGATHPETISDRGSAPAAPGRAVTHCSEIGFFMGSQHMRRQVDAFAAVVCAAGSQFVCRPPPHERKERRGTTVIPLKALSNGAFTQIL